MNEVSDGRGAGNVRRFPNRIASEAREKVGETDGTDTAKERPGHARAMGPHRKRGGRAGYFASRAAPETEPHTAPFDHFHEHGSAFPVRETAA